MPHFKYNKTLINIQILHGQLC